MTERGTFIINGTERVVVTQLVRSPGAYVMEPKDREKQVFIANLMPARGSWLELEIDKKGRVYVRIDRKRKLPVTVLLRAMGYASDEEILNLFENSLYIRNTVEADPEVTRTEEGALIELFKKQRRATWPSSTMPPRPCRCRASPSRITSMSTSTSATAVCAPSGS
jgi:DNA-directed RNA polymerase subunit beta